jgi:ABC-type nitrate/sulfonate/bicarbonate transport system permease component
MAQNLAARRSLRLAGSYAFWREALWPAGAIFAVLVIWQIVGSGIDPIFFAPPSAIVAAVPKVLQRGLIEDYGDTLVVFLGSVTVSVLLGVVVGLVLGNSKYLKHFLGPVIVALYGTPTILLIPLLIVWLGDGFASTFLLVFVASFFPMVFNVQLGVSEISGEALELGAAFGATRRELIRDIMIPSTIPYIFAGLRMAVPRAFSAVLGAEMLLSGMGTGGLILYYGNAFQTDRYFVPVVLVAVTAYALTVGLDLLETRLMPWRADRSG